MPCIMTEISLRIITSLREQKLILLILLPYITGEKARAQKDEVTWPDLTWFTQLVRGRSAILPRLSDSNFVLVPLCPSGVSSPGPWTGTSWWPVSNRGTQQEASGLVSKLHLYLQLLPVAHITASAPPPVRSAVASHSHGSGDPAVFASPWNYPLTPLQGKMVFHETCPWHQKGWGCWCTWLPQAPKQINSCPVSSHCPRTVPILAVTFWSCGFWHQRYWLDCWVAVGSYPTPFALSLICKDLFLGLYRRPRATLPQDSLASDLELMKERASLVVKFPGLSLGPLGSKSLLCTFLDVQLWAGNAIPPSPGPFNCKRGTEMIIVHS